MATFTFITTEDDRPGGGVYRIPGEGPTWTIKQSDYPGVNLTGLTKDNFFVVAGNNQGATSKSTVNIASWSGSRYFGGDIGDVKLSVSTSALTVEMENTMNRACQSYVYNGTGKWDDKIETPFVYTLYMSRNPIIKRS